MGELTSIALCLHAAHVRKGQSPRSPCVSAGLASALLSRSRVVQQARYQISSPGPKVWTSSNFTADQLKINIVDPYDPDILTRQLGKPESTELERKARVVSTTIVTDLGTDRRCVNQSPKQCLEKMSPVNLVVT